MMSLETAPELARSARSEATVLHKHLLYCEERGERCLLKSLLARTVVAARAASSLSSSTPIASLRSSN